MQSGTSSTSLKRTHCTSSLACNENLPKQWILREATKEELLKLKPLNFDQLTETYDLYMNRYHFCIAGGFAAWVEGMTTDYNDIDHFIGDRVEIQSRFPNTNTYIGTKIRRIVNDGNAQRMYMFYNTKGSKDKFESQVNFAKWVLEDFDIKECKVAYFYSVQRKKIYYLRENFEYTQKELLALNPIRMKKYIDRSKSVHSLKYLALSAVKLKRNNFYITVKKENQDEEYLSVSDCKDFIEKLGINITN